MHFLTLETPRNRLLVIVSVGLNARVHPPGITVARNIGNSLPRARRVARRAAEEGQGASRVQHRIGRAGQVPHRGQGHVLGQRDHLASGVDRAVLILPAAELPALRRGQPGVVRDGNLVVGVHRNQRQLGAVTVLAGDGVLLPHPGASQRGGAVVGIPQFLGGAGSGSVGRQHPIARKSITGRRG